MTGLNKVLSMALICGFLMAGVIFFQGAMSATDEGIDMTGSAYEDVYDTSTVISIQSISIINVIMLIVAIMAIIMAVKTFADV